MAAHSLSPWVGLNTDSACMAVGPCTRLEMLEMLTFHPFVYYKKGEVREAVDSSEGARFSNLLPADLVGVGHLWGT